MRRRHLISLLFLTLILVASALPILTYPLGRDQGEFATMGRGLLDGKAPYTDLWNPKPPAIFVVYSLINRLFGENPWAIRLIDLFQFPILAAAVYWLGWRLHRPLTGLIAVAVVGTLYFSESFWTLSQNDGVALVPMGLAAALTLKTLDAQHPSRWAFLAGLSAGVVMWFKYPFALFVGALVVAQIVNRRGAWERLIKDAVAFAAGGLLVLGAGAAILHAHGALAAMIDSARVTSGYTRLSYPSLFQEVTWRQAFTDRWSHWGLLLPWVLIWPAINRHAVLPAAARIAWLWLTSAVLILIVQAKGYDYHWLPILPPAALIAAHSVSLLIEAAPPLISRRVLGAGAIAGLICVEWLAIWPGSLGYLTGQQDRMVYYDGFRGGDFSAAESQQVADYLRVRAVYGDSLFVYGFRTEIYFLTGLRPATRFIFQFPLVGSWYPAAWRQENADVLWAALPPYVLVLQGDYMPWVTGRDLDSNSLLQEDTELNNWLIHNYTFETQIGGFLIWKRKREPASG